MKKPMPKGSMPMPKGFEQSKFDKDTKKAPEGSKAGMARDIRQVKPFMQSKKMGGKGK